MRAWHSRFALEYYQLRPLTHQLVSPSQRTRNICTCLHLFCLAVDKATGELSAARARVSEACQIISDQISDFANYLEDCREARSRERLARRATDLAVAGRRMVEDVTKVGWPGVCSLSMHACMQGLRTTACMYAGLD